MDKNDFIFPIRIFHGFCLDYKDDFVLVAALMKFSNDSYREFLCDKAGNIIGFSKKGFHFFKENFHFLEKKHLKRLNLSYFIPELEKTFKSYKESKKGQRIIYNNRSGRFFISNQLKEMVDRINVFDDYSTKVNKDKSNHKSLISFVTNKSSISALLKIKEKLIPNTDKDSSSPRHKPKESCGTYHYINFDLSCSTYETKSSINGKNLIYIYLVRINSFRLANLTLNPIVSKEQIREKTLNNFSFLSDDMISDTQGIGMIIPPRNNPHFRGLILEKPINTLQFLEEKPSSNEIIQNPIIELFDSREKKENIKEIEEKRVNFSNEANIIDENNESSSTHKITSFEEFEVGKTNNNNNNKAKVISEKASSIDDTRKNQHIFKKIDLIQEAKPGCLKNFSLSLFIEIIMIFCYLGIVVTFYQEYMSKDYEPAQKSLINYSILATSLSYSTAIFTEMEYHEFNYTKRKLSPFKLNILKRILDQNYDWMKNINYYERSIYGGLGYQDIFKTTTNLLIDYETYQIKTVGYSNNLDFFSTIIYQAKTSPNFTLEKQFKIIFQRNYPYTLLGTSVIYLAVKNDFINSNAGTSDKVFNFLIVFAVFTTLIKLFELFTLNKYYELISQLINIFRRVSLQEAIFEKKFCQETLEIMNGPFLNFDFIEKKVEKNQDFEDLKHILSKDNKKNKKSKNQKGNKAKKFSRSSVKSLHKNKILVLMTIIILISFLYYFSNYFFWLNNNSSINNLIQINCFFIDVYVYSTSIIGFGSLAIREKIVRNPDYEAVKEYYQNHTNRMAYLYASLMRRVYIINNSSSFHLPRYTIDAENNLNDPELNNLVHNNVCKFLVQKGIVFPEEMDFCESSFHGAFKNGVIALVNEYIFIIKSYDDLIRVIKENNTKEIEEQKKAVEALINSQEYEDFIFSYYYYHNTLLIYYNMVNDYYKNVMDREMKNLEIFLYLTSIFTSLIFVFLAFYVKKLLETRYKDASFCLSLIPHEKIITDEQAKFLIQNFYKKI